MAELVKKWSDGGSLLVTYDGDPEGSAVFSSEINEGIDRELSVTFKAGGLSVERTVQQTGMREQFVTADGLVFYASDGLFAVLKNNPRALPEGLSAIAYLQGDGKSWIDTGIMPTYTTRVVADVSHVDVSFLWGVRDTASGTSPRQFGLYRRAETSLRSYYFGTNKDAIISITNDRGIVEQDGNVVSAFGITITNNAVTGGVTSYPLYLYALNTAGTASGMSTMRLYGCQIYDGDSLLRDYTPCLDIDGYEGLYDYISGEFTRLN